MSELAVIGADVLPALLAKPTSEKIGIAVAVLLDAADKDPRRLHAVLDAVVVNRRDGATIRQILLGEK